MAVAAAQDRPTRPSAPELLQRARDIGARAREAALTTEANRTVAPALVDRMRDAGLFKILQPAHFGGYEYGFDVFAEAVAAVGAGDGSTGWVYSLGAVHQWLIGCFPREAQEEAWSQNPDAVAAVSYAPTGKTIRVPGGYRLSGRWSFASGCNTAQWGILAGLRSEDGGRTRPAFFLLPLNQTTIDDDWFAMGLTGTGSNTIVVDDVLVPDHRIVPFADLLVGNGPGRSFNPNPLYGQPFLAVVPTCLTAPALGMARGALQVFLDQVGTRSTRGAVAGGNNRMADFQTIQMRIGEATASIDAASLMIHRDIAETEALVRRGEPVSIDVRLRNRLTHAFSVKLLVQAVDALFLAAGGSSLSMKHPLQRFWRDIHAAGTHISVNWDAVSSMYGQHALGLEPKGQY
jgi:alkylation response protein AidB-like acyl-CoA dehydrogenase